VKRITAIFALTIFSLAIFLPFSLNIKTASAQNTGYSIQNVDHQVEVMYSGHLVIRDTIQVTGQLTDGFLIGFPHQYGSHVLKGVAYDANGILPMSLGVQVAGQSDFYGANVSFPQGSPQNFTVVFILSNDLAYQDLAAGVVSFNFPAYPSLAEEAANCNITLVLPDFASGVTVSKEDGEVDTTNFVKENLAAFTYSPASASFSLPSGILQIVDIKSLDRVITISPVGDAVASDSYRIVNNSTGSIGSFDVNLPLNASNIVGRDEFGRTLTVELLGTGATFQLVNVTFILPLNSSESTLLTVEYTLPSVSPEQITRFALNLDLFPYLDYYIDEASVTIVPPEGAQFLTPQLSSIDPSLSLSREVFQETLSINREGVSHIDFDVPSENALQITYDYNPLWLSFYPTLWVWMLAVVGSIVVAFWRRPKPSAPLRIGVPKLPIGLSPDHVRAFTEAYEEKNRITSELKFLDIRAQKGKIPRRRYKVQRRTLEVRFDALSRNIAELKEIFRSAGGNYADLIRQLDVAETELSEVETNIRSVEARHRRGELSLEEYKKFLADYQRRKEKAETAINGILLRLREEIR
jgi:hypothetical protein